jgi:class 3 adenylate cyclase/tetratricopeptide (TPR) repeat protein
MECPRCHHANADGARFCGECGASLLLDAPCASCGQANPAGQEFCNGCGQRLGESAGAAERAPRAYTPPHLAEKILTSRAALEGERKQVTVLFADVKGSMDLAEKLDPEVWHAVMDRFFQLLADGVHRFEGTVNQYMGDGIMALFGAPVAHEDHARRACYAALHLADELRRYATELRLRQGLSFSVRMGLNSGEVVVGKIGDDLRMDYTALGHTVGLAARMEQLAEPGKVFLTEQTARLVAGFFTLRDLGESAVKGVAAPLRVYELEGVGSLRTRLDVARARGFSRFVGRTEEMASLEAALGRAVAGTGQIIGVVAEAGVGKSRLCHEFTERARAQGIAVYDAHCVAHGKMIPFFPILELLRGYFGITDQDGDEAARRKVAGTLLLLDPELTDGLPLLLEFLGVPDPERPVPRMDPEARQRQLFQLIRRLVHARSRREPAVLLIDDLHWIDGASEAFVETVIEALSGTRTLFLVNFRPEYHAGWTQKSYYQQLPLRPLGPEAIAELLASLLGTDPSLAALVERVRERTRGNPFFIEEVVQSLLEAGTLQGARGSYCLARPVAEVAIPATVQAVLAARIDRLPEREKQVLQTAAVIGKEFSEPILQAVVELPPSELAAALRALVAAEFLYEAALFPQAEYAFRHPLTQEVAYRSQLAERRARVHAAVARAIAAQYPERLDERAALLAQHWEAAGEKLEAARWHARAASWSGTSDPTQALRHWRKVRELADALPESAETVALGLTARSFSLIYGWRLGISHEEAEAVFSEAEWMASKAGDIGSRAILLSAYGIVRGLNEGDVREYARLARQAFALAEESGDPALCVGAAPTAFGLMCTGEYREGVAIYDRAIELADGDVTVGAGVLFACPYALCHALKGLHLVELGELEEARRLLEQGRKIAREQGDIEVVGWSHQWSTWLAYFQGEPEAALGHAQQALEIAERIGGSMSRAYAWFTLGWAERMRGEWRQAIKALERSLAIARESRTQAERDVSRLALLGESYLGLGDLERARALVAEGLAIAQARGHRSGETHTSLALARVLLGSAGPAARAEIEAALARALELARDTGAKAFEPLVHVERAELARQSGDEEGRARELREAHRLFTAMGAAGHAARLARELGSSTESTSGISSTSRT